MPRTKTDYSNTIIYKIVCNDLNITDCYVGHTTNFRHRKSQHKCTCNNEKNKDYNLKIYKTIRDNGGWWKWSMIEIEKYPCNDKNEACSRERFYYEQLNSTMNTLKPMITRQELKDLNKQYKQTEKYKAVAKIYGKKHREEHKEYYDKKNKEMTCIVVDCPCGCNYSYKHKARHERTKRHIDNMAKLLE